MCVRGPALRTSLLVLGAGLFILRYFYINKLRP